MPPVYFRCGHLGADPLHYQIPGDPSRLVLPVTEMRDVLEDGIHLFNDERYFEAHEAFEDLWRVATGDLKLFYQGVVQACAGLVKHQRGEDGPAVTLLHKGLAKIESAGPSCRSGIDTAALAADLRRTLHDLEHGYPPGPPAIRRA